MMQSASSSTFSPGDAFSIDEAARRWVERQRQMQRVMQKQRELRMHVAEVRRRAPEAASTRKSSRNRLECEATMNGDGDGEREEKRRRMEIEERVNGEDGSIPCHAAAASSAASSASAAAVASASQCSYRRVEPIAPSSESSCIVCLEEYCSHEPSCAAAPDHRPHLLKCGNKHHVCATCAAQLSEQESPTSVKTSQTS